MAILGFGMDLEICMRKEEGDQQSVDWLSLFLKSNKFERNKKQIKTRNLIHPASESAFPQ
jgi:hypothetical protein